MKKAILGKKLGMTQIFKEDGTVVPVTVIQAGPCTVIQITTLRPNCINPVSSQLPLFHQQTGIQILSLLI